MVESEKHFDSNSKEDWGTRSGKQTFDISFEP